MSWTIIVASSEPDQLEELRKGAKEIAAHISSPGGTSVVCATCTEDVRKRRSLASGRMQLLIIAASLPDRESAPDQQTEPGLELIKSIVQESESSACILVSERVEHYRSVQGMKYCEWLAVDCSTNYVEQCLLLARKLGIISAEPVALAESSRAARPIVRRMLPKVSGVASIAGSPVPEVMPPTPANEPSPGLLQQPDGTAKPYALIEVELPREVKFATVRLEIHEPQRIKKSEPEPLNLNQSTVTELVKDSQALKDRLSKALQDPGKWRRYLERWEADYQALGERVGNLLWSTRFNSLYHLGHGAADGNVRLRFSLEQPCFDGLWEAIFDALGQRYLMLDNTITRRARLSNSNGLSIFANDTNSQHAILNQIGARDGTLNVLVIQSNVPDGSAPDGPDDLLWTQHWESLNGTLPNLPHLEDEVKVIRDLQSGRRRTKNGRHARPQVKVDVLRLRAPRRSWSLAEQAERTLRDPSRRYDIVHFAGHALFATGTKHGDGRGYLIFSGHPKPSAVSIATVATWLEKAGVQLVYLSCCRSSAAPAALEFARNHVPMTIGFHWDLDDSKAVDFAKHFYDELLQTDLKVCPAMRRARRRLYEKHEAGDPIWASPVLVAQPMDWLQVEGVLRPAGRDRRPQPSALPPRVPRSRIAVSRASEMAPVARPDDRGRHPRAATVVGKLTQAA